MNFVLKRSPALSDGQFGIMTSEDGVIAFHSLERLFGGSPLIPVGTYTCRRRMSPKFGYDVFQIMNVPGHDFIEIHCANFQSDLEGCVGIGLDQSKSWTGANMLLNSKVAFTKFMDLQTGVDEFNLVIS